MTALHVHPGHTLQMIQDVKTCWDSTFLMIERVWKLQSAVDVWLEIEAKHECTTSTQNKQSLSVLKLHPSEWLQLKHLLEILQHFYAATKLLSITSELCIQHAWREFNDCFTHLEQQKKDAKGASVKTWFHSLNTVLDAANAKLSKYYSHTDQECGWIYNAAVILDPTQKLKTYKVQSAVDDYPLS
jgi:hypothetical protein